MSESNKKTRDQAIPFEASAFSNSSLGDDGTTDAGLIKSSNLLVVIRCATPDRGALTEAHLNLIMAVNASTTAKIAIGRFDTNGIDAVQSYTQEEIDRMHKAITGGTSPIASSAGTLLLDGLNIFPLVPKRGHANFNPDGFVIILQFNRARSSSNDILRTFSVMCSAQLGVV